MRAGSPPRVLMRASGPLRVLIGAADLPGIPMRAGGPLGGLAGTGGRLGVGRYRARRRSRQRQRRPLRDRPRGRRGLVQHGDRPAGHPWRCAAARGQPGGRLRDGAAGRLPHPPGRHHPHDEGEPDRRHAGPVAPVHVGLGRPPGQQAVDDAQDPGQVGGGVQRAPRPGRADGGKTRPQDPGHQDEQEQVRRDGAQPQVQGAPLVQERHHGVGGPGAPGDYLGRDVDEQEAHRAERDGPVHRLGDDPAARGHDDPVRREQADAYRRGEPDKGEDSRIKEQEMHQRHVNGVTGHGYSGDDQHAHENN